MPSSAKSVSSNTRFPPLPFSHPVRKEASLRCRDRGVRHALAGMVDVVVEMADVTVCHS